MKAIVLFGFLFTCLLLMQCTPKTASELEKTTTTTTTTTTSTTETMTEEEKEEIKKELKDEIKKEIEAEMAAEAEEKMGINEPKTPETTITTEPAKPAKPDVISVETANNILQGAWAWQETVYQVRGVGNQVDSPEGRGYTKTAVFKSGNVCEILINNFPAGTYNYTISDGNGELFIRFTSPDNNTQHMENGPLKMEDNFFEIRGGYNDKGGTIRYSRK